MKTVTKQHTHHKLIHGASLAAALMLTPFVHAQTSTELASPTGAAKDETFTLSSSGVKLNTNIVTKAGRFVSPASVGVCVEEPPLENFTQTGSFVSVPGFVLGEELGVILNAPAAHYPIEITRVRIGWGSAAGGQPDSLEDSILIYPAGLPNPGIAQYSIGGPVLVDGAINEFDLTTAAGGVGSRIINSGPFTVSLKIFNSQSPGTPAPLHDGNGCQLGKNVIFASPSFAWFDACLLGVSGDWVFSVTYRRLNCGIPNDCNNNGVDDTQEIAGNPALDCDLDGTLDSCQIAANPALDANTNGVLDSCETPIACPSDLTLDGIVNAADLAQLLANWGVCP